MTVGGIRGQAVAAERIDSPVMTVGGIRGQAVVAAVDL
jgi:hypothetical protein